MVRRYIFKSICSNTIFINDTGKFYCLSVNLDFCNAVAIIQYYNKTLISSFTNDHTARRSDSSTITG